MKKILYLFISLVFLCSCSDDTSDNIGEDQEPDVLENSFTLDVDGAIETLSFDCLNSLSAYGTGARTDQTTDKFIFDQGYSFIDLSSGQRLVYQFILFTEQDIRLLSATELSSLISENPDLLGLEVSLMEGENVFKNQFYDLSSLGPGYDARNIVADNELFNFSIGDINTFECLDNIEIIALDVSYSGIIKTEDESEQRSISLNMDTHLRTW